MPDNRNQTHPSGAAASLLILGKDLRQRTRDRSAYILGIIAPLALAAILSSVLAGVTGGGPSFTFAVADEDRGEVARAFVDDVLGGLEQDGVITIVKGDAGSVERKVADGEAAAAFVIPSGFTSLVLAGQPSTIEVLTDVGRPTAGQVASSIAGGFASQLSAIQLAVATAITAEPGGDLASLAARAATGSVPLALEPTPAVSKQLDETTYFSAGLAIFFLFFTVQFGIASLLEERRVGTLPRILAAPVGRNAVVAGKGLSSLTVGLVSMAVLVVATTLLLGASWGDPFGVTVLVVAAVIAAIGIMAVVATFARTTEQANNWQSIVAIVLGLLGGSFFPVAQGPGMLADASMLTPHAWFLRGLGDLAAGGDVRDILGAAGAILVFAVVALAIAGARRGRMTST